MPVIRVWIPELYDTPLLKLHHAGLTDPEIGDRMHFSPAEVTKARRRLGLRPNKRFTAPHPRSDDTSSVTFRPDPLEIARKTVPGFNRDKMTLHSKPIKLVAVMKLCNRRLKAEGRDQLGPESWRV